MTIQIGTAPVSYGIFGTSGDRNAGETLLDSAAAAGFSGLELGPPALFGTPRETAERFRAGPLAARIAEVLHAAAAALATTGSGT